MKKKPLLTVITCIFASLTVFDVSLPAEPVKLHPENPHYLMYNGKPTILITSAEHYGSVLNLDFDFMVYLKEMQSKGMNLTRVFSGVYCEDPASFDIEKNTLAPRWNKFITPFARSETPGYPFGGNKFDLDKWDDNYFQRLKNFMSEAAKRDIIVEFVLFCPFYGGPMWNLSPMNAKNNVNGYSTLTREEAYTLKDAKLTGLQDKTVNKISTLR